MSAESPRHQKAAERHDAESPKSAVCAVESPWAKTADEVLDELSVGRDGLSADEVEERRQRWGRNLLRGIERRSPWEILREQVESLIMVLLVAAMMVSFFSGQRIEAVAIFGVIVLNTAIGFFTEWRAVRSMEALQKLGKAHATVRREGLEARLEAEELVPGDVVVLESGDPVPADARLITVEDLEVDESALTGESVPVSKKPDAQAENTELAERFSMVYKGTGISRGRAVAVVVATGMATELGSISEMVEEAETRRVPLEKKLDQLGQRLVWLTVAVAAVVIGVGALAGRELFLMIETGIALAVAAIPEGLPIVATVALAAGMRRMLRRNALVRRLSSVETLGATTLICTDKTGTLTKNEMSVRRLVLARGATRERQIEADDEGEVEGPDDDPLLRDALEVAVLCVAAELPAEEEEASGDPMELALLRFGRVNGFERSERLAEREEVRVEPFNRRTQMMATFHRQEHGESGLLVAVKGAPREVVAHCTRIRTAEGEIELDDAGRQHWLEISEDLAAQGLRLLGLARKTTDDRDADPYEGLCFLGHVGLLDPPRTEMRGVIEKCHDAGIRVVMVTGDHPATAQNVARAVGLVDNAEAEAVSGADFPAAEKISVGELSDEERQRFLAAPVFARVDPKQKLDLIDLHQESGQVVAMTGDGVNDAPALRSADIGIAMGRRGTEVAREAADMVLQDDAFSTIAAAVEQGRVIFANIRKFVVYLLSGNVGEILAVGAAVSAGSALPLLPLQILYLNMINDVFPALALGVGEKSGEVMERPPRDPEEPVLRRRDWGSIGFFGLVIAGAILGAFYFVQEVLGASREHAVTAAFLTLSLSRLAHAFNMREPSSGLWRNEISDNPYMWGAFAVSVALLALALYLPALAGILGVVPPSLGQWGVIAVASLAPLLVGQVTLIFSNR